METMKDYHDLYLKCNVLLSADVFKKFRNNSLNNYGFCPSHYLSAPVLSRDAMLNMTTVELEIISDPDMCIFFEKDMRGGVSYISRKFDNKYLKSCNPKQASKHIISLDANNLHGYAISKFLLTSSSDG